MPTDGMGPVIEAPKEGGRRKGLDPASIDAIIQVACLVLLAGWTFYLVEPFVAVIAWSLILAVVLYPLFDLIVTRLRLNQMLAALLVTCISIAVLLGPATWLGVSLVGTLRELAMRLGSGGLALPAPPASVKDWPLIGDGVYQLWLLASTNMEAALAQVGPQLEPFSGKLLGFAGNAGIGMIEFLSGVLISGILLVPGPSMVDTAKKVARRLAARRGDEFVDMSMAAIRGLARGVIGIAILQALLVGIGFIVAGVPAPGLLSFLVLLLAIVQIGAFVVLVPLMAWSWFAFDTTTFVLFWAYMLPVGACDNFLRPFVMGHGLKTPAAIIFIGLIGGIIVHGVIGLFVGPIVLAISWELVQAWIKDETPISIEPQG
jgi:predicted PurR-regulated permease PerM